MTAAAELRWLRDARTGGALAAVLLSDAPLSLGGGWVEITTKRAAVIGTNPTAYLLWGKAVRSADGWTTLAEARVGAVPVPLADVPEGGRVVLRATEYLAADEFGAAYVLDERLTQLEAADA